MKTNGRSNVCVGLRVLALIVGLGLVSSGTVVTGQQSKPQTRPEPAQTQPAGASRADLPAAKEIIDASIQAMGGRTAFEAIDSIAIKGVASTKDAEGPMDLKANKAHGLLFIQDSQKGQTAVGSDGEVGWQRLGLDYRLVPPEQLVMVRNELSMFTYRLVSDPSDFFETMETVDRVKLDEGGEAYKVRMVFKDQPDSGQFWYFNAGDKLLVKVEQLRETNMGAFVTTRKVSDWKTFDTVKLFTKRSIQRPGAPDNEATIVYNDVQFNNVDPAVFELPAEVQELLKQGDAPPPPAPAAPATAPSTQPATRPEAPEAGRDE